jgi:hypothetical protein
MAKVTKLVTRKESHLTEVRVTQGSPRDGYSVATTGNGYQYWTLFTCKTKAKAMRIARLISNEFKSPLTYISYNQYIKELSA